jgi:hypothetical protein
MQTDSEKLLFIDVKAFSIASGISLRKCESHKEKRGKMFELLPNKNKKTFLHAFYSHVLEKRRCSNSNLAAVFYVTCSR